ncbi:ATP-binding protein [Leclercia adecarboxylata]|uniref:ATP-binding protein n=1 Tax=Leclercia adecarboxylata TaxID=83655 RepID=UPI00254B3B10|nr:hypothetical protein [Leclercia adecarboxylata]
MKLISLFLKGREGIGLESDELVFGKEITELYGPNGCGKTPLIQSIAFCLGYPCKFRDEIYRSCKFSRLKFEHNNVLFIAEREFSTDFIVSLSFHNTVKRFYNELEYSKFIFNLIGINSPSLITTQNKQTYPYLSTLLPIFYLDQDSGYTKYYHSSFNYIRDQFSEMLRLLFSLPEKNSFEKKKLSIDLDAEINYLDEVLVLQRRNIELAKDDIVDKEITIEDIEKQLGEFEGELSALKESNSIKNDALIGIDSLINTYKLKHRSLLLKVDDLVKRCESLNKIKIEINTEINTLNLNEEAKRIFLSFDEICPSANCGLFNKSTENYAKNLLYLKDQIKDLDRSIKNDSINMENLNIEISQIKNLIVDAVNIRAGLVKDEGISSIVETISLITNRIFELQLQKGVIEKVEKLELKYVETINKRNYALDRKESVNNVRANLPSLIKIKNEIRDAYIKWLDILNIINVSKDISFKDDFSPLLGNENIEQLKGSTRVRAILAYRAALIETIAKHGIKSFEFIIFDTPKQHEIHYGDINDFMMGLKKLANELNFQIVFSSTEYLFPCDGNDQLWEPKYPGEKHSMFMKHI